MTGALCPAGGEPAVGSSAEASGVVPSTPAGCSKRYSPRRFRRGRRPRACRELAPWFPVGIDAGIIAFLALDLYLIRKGTPWPLLRMAAHATTGATIWCNASSWGHIGTDPVKAASHSVMPILFVIGVEAARRLITDELLPMKMAAHGYSVAQALAMSEQ
ncbi:DUF2637 domain-containing protein [Streptomyces sp. DHE17-7]|uniref:DUF2637 domain-containing protein n=1 Tax=Streptomyces sp. DHE17-7 TaxID=2759949 RepID=UPI0022EB850A|nr:DUF2637 domain-containing protein [Streptomyces sp. DHE17-7]